MKIEFLQRDSHNTRLILIAAGWTAGPEIAEEINMPGWDVAVIHDFSELSLDLGFLEEYYTVYLFAWSLGVYVASRFLLPDKITAAFAINGTLSPADDKRGIPVGIFKGTLQGLNERNLLKFRMRMTDKREDAMHLAERGNNDITNLQAQLQNILDDTRDHREGLYKLPWTKIFISRNDKIFPLSNQKMAWDEDCDCDIIELNAPHYADLRSIVRMVIADTQTVSKRFSKASVTYDTHAIAQYSAAIKLAGFLKDYTSKRNGSTLEIGCGTGLFTREYSRFLHPESAEFVDITQTGPFDIAGIEAYHVMDAERWIELNNNIYDFILSTSAIQWFADIPRFLKLCSHRLSEQGVLAISTFLPGNMAELDEVRPNPLRYPTSEQLRTWLEGNYEDIRIIEDEIHIEFKSVREMLMHLKHTGVAGSAPSSQLPMKDMGHLRSLTYRPVYILARKKTDSI
ncbi:MAG: DUF452 family protein [Bacteroides sp.]|nr:DUF452 family protein [Bacteroides sp.]